MLYFKKSVKWIKGYFSLVGVVSFGAGVYSLALVDLFYFSEEITPPAFSAAFTGGAFMLACYTAVRVNRWIDSKANDVAFKRSEEFLNSLSTFRVKTIQLIRAIESIVDTKEISQENKGLMHEELSYAFEEYLKSFTSFIIISEQLESWGVKFKMETAFDKATKLLDKDSSATKIRTALRFLNKITLQKNTHVRDSDEIIKLLRVSLPGYNSFDLELATITKSHYKDIFEYKLKME